jgi:protein O-GlcNAc transferase
MSVSPALQSAFEHSKRGNHAAAESVCREMLASNPTDARVWCHLGTTFLSRRRFPEAADAYARAVQYQPQFTEAINNLGVALARMNRVEEAVEQFRRAAAQRPGWAEPYISMGNLFVNLDRLDAAADAFRQAVRSEPRRVESHELLGGVLARLGRLEEARPLFLETVRLQPRAAGAHSNFLLALNYDPTIESSVLLAEHRWFDRLHGQGLSPVAPHANSRDPKRRLRIGYVTPDFRRHAVAWFMLPVLEAHDAAQFEVFAYVQQTENDGITQRMRSFCAGWHPTIGRPDQQVVEQIRADRIDILVDLAGHTGGNRVSVFAHRPAPVQITYLGYPTTTGLAAMDYLLTDEVLDPPAETNWHSEELVRLPETWCCFVATENAPPVVEPPCLKNGYITFGWLHKLAKLNAPMLDVWANVLRAVPDSRLLVFRNTMDKSVRERLVREFSARGIDSARLNFHAGQYKEGFHLSVYELIDISLDSLPWSGHATTCESLWMGVPMVTIRGQRHAGRMSASILHSQGLDELIAEDPGQYIKITSALANDREKLKRLRQALRPRMQASKLCDGKIFTQNLEAIYRQLWRRWCESDPSKC